MLYLEVILPLPLRVNYHYSLPEEVSEELIKTLIGRRVTVSLGPKRYYTGIINQVTESLPSGTDTKKIKPISALLDEEPIVGSLTLNLWKWIAYYYACPIGLVLRASMPKGLLPESKTQIVLNNNFVATGELSPIQYQVLDLLSAHKERSIPLLVLETQLQRNLSNIIAQLIALGAVYTEEHLHSSYKSRKQVFIGFAPAYQTEEAINEAFNLLRRSKRQQEVIESLLSLLIKHQEGYSGKVVRTDLTKGQSSHSSHIRALIDKGILEIEERDLSRLDALPSPSHSPYTERPPISIDRRAISLIYAHRSKSREEIVVRMVRECIQAGGQVLLLLPSVYNTPANLSYMTALYEAASGAVYHYHPLVSEAIRVEIYRKISKDREPCLIIGNRSAILLPMEHLRLIIVDEEHEYLYKQQFSSPHYHARDVALWIAQRRHIPIVLTSESPSAETLFNVLRGKYQIIHSHQVVEEPQLPPPIPIRRIDMSEVYSSRSLPFGHVISPELFQEMNTTLAMGQRVLLLQNRRGYAPFIHCDQCDSSIHCPRCEVSLTYHRHHQRLLCHYCGYEQPLPRACPNCHATHIYKYDREYPALRPIGYGVERIEEELAELFPNETLLRIDGDSLQTAKRASQLQEKIAQGKANIIIGTQLIKGQPIWDNIGLIAIPQLGTILGFQDFRADERAYQLLYQLILRALEHQNSETQLKVVVQYNNPNEYFLEALEAFDYSQFIKNVLKERETFNFPPFVRQTHIALKSADELLVGLIAQRFTQILLPLFPEHRIAATQPAIGRIDDVYIRQIVLRRPLNYPYERERELLRQGEDYLHNHYPESRRVRIEYDVDPL